MAITSFNYQFLATHHGSASGEIVTFFTGRFLTMFLGFFTIGGTTKSESSAALFDEPAVDVLL